MNNLLKNSAKLLSANAFAQILGIIIYPILTRLYAPEDFGLLNLFLSVASILIMFSTAEYQNAIILAKDEKTAVAVSYVCAIGISIVTALLLLSLPVSSHIVGLFKAPELASVYWMLPLFILLSGVWVVLNYWFTRRGAFSHISGYQVSQSVLSAGIKTGLGYAPACPTGLVIGSVSAPLLALIGGISIGRKHLRPLLHIPSRDDIRAALREFRRFPIYSLPRNLTNTIGGNLPTILLVPAFGLTQVGFYGMVLTLAFRPIQLIVGSIYQPLFQQVSNAVHERQSIWATHTRYLKSMGALCLFFIPIYFITPWLVKWLLGNDWAVTADMIRLSLPWLAMMFIGAPLAYISDVFGKQKIAFRIEVVYLLLRIASILIGIHTGDILLAIALMSASGTLIIAFQVLCYVKWIREYERTIA